jgi:hypothetical protein
MKIYEWVVHVRYRMKIKQPPRAARLTMLIHMVRSYESRTGRAAADM